MIDFMADAQADLIIRNVTDLEMKTQQSARKVDNAGMKIGTQESAKKKIGETDKGVHQLKAQESFMDCNQNVDFDYRLGHKSTESEATEASNEEYTVHEILALCTDKTEGKELRKTRWQ